MMHPFWAAFWTTTGVLCAVLAFAIAIIAVFNLVGKIVEGYAKAATKSKGKSKRG